MIDSEASSSSDQDIRAVLRGKDTSAKPRELFLRTGDTIQLGREIDNDIVLEQAHISRRHAVIIWRNERFEISDLGSINGTYVNDELITQAQALHDGDIIRLDTVELGYSWLGKVDRSKLDTDDERKTLIILPETPQPHLLISAGPEEGKNIRLSPGKMVIGRATSKKNWDIALQDHSISRPHAQIEMHGNEFILTDLESANGTLLNGEAIQAPSSLQDGDVILMGETTLLFRNR